tara:strand:+ start:916 stop:2049 length:1134 start_codon:yes stop_codon:yes gene_type:complete
MKHTSKFILMCAVLVFTILSACKSDDNAVQGSLDQNIKNSEVISLHTIAAIEQKIPRYYSATGYTHISRSIEISTSQSATIRELHVNEGDVVKAGTLLLALDESELKTSIKHAKSAIQTAVIRLKDSRYDFNTAKRLSESKVVPVEAFRKAKVQLEIAQSQLAQAQSELKRHEARQPYHRITSPIDARVIKRWVNQGDLAVIGKPLLQLEAIQGLEFETAIPTQWLNKISLGDTYAIVLHYRDIEVTGKVSHIVHSTNRVTQTSQIKLVIDTQTSLEHKLTAGLSGQISFEIAQDNHLLIPESALVTKAGVLGVYRTDQESIARFTPVKIERSWLTKTSEPQRVVLSGLLLGERVVLMPPKALHDGMKIDAIAEDIK